MIELLKKHRFSLVVFAVAALCIFLDTRWAPRHMPLLLEDGWVAAVYLPVPMVAIWFLDAKRTTAARVAWLVGAALILSPVIWRTTVDGDLFLEEPLWLVVPASIATVALALALRLGGVRADDWGLGLGDWRWWAPWTALLLAAAVALSVGAALWIPGMAEHYPLHKPARTDFGELVRYQALLGVYMVGWEHFFRGFMMFGVSRKTGPVIGALVQAMPFMLLHRGKPRPEMAASFVGGTLLALFCWRGRSFWPAVLLHWALNMAMEVAAFIIRN